jgi:hypothetical protein
MSAIRPEEIAAAKTRYFPEYVFDAFNQLLTEKYISSSQSVTIRQDDVITLMINLAGGTEVISRDDIFKRGYLNIEEVYRSSGWEVDYDKPAYNEDYPATYKFTPSA